MLNNIYITES